MTSERTIDLDKLAAELAAIGWSVEIYTDMLGAKLIKGDEDFDNILVHQNGKVAFVSCVYWDALDIIRKHVAPTPAITDNQQFLHLAAFRYALGRRTYGVGIVADELLRVAKQLDQNTRTIIVREITEAEARDGLGDACDAARWHEVRDRFKELGVGE